MGSSSMPSSSDADPPEPAAESSQMDGEDRIEAGSDVTGDDLNLECRKGSVFVGGDSEVRELDCKAEKVSIFGDSAQEEEQVELAGSESKDVSGGTEIEEGSVLPRVEVVESVVREEEAVESGGGGRVVESEVAVEFGVGREGGVEVFAVENSKATESQAVSAEGRGIQDGSMVEEVQVETVVTEEVVTVEVVENREEDPVVEREVGVESSVGEEGRNGVFKVENSEDVEAQVVSEVTEVKDGSMVDRISNDAVEEDQPQIASVVAEVGEESNVCDKQEASISLVASVCDEANTVSRSDPIDGVADIPVEEAESHVVCETEPETCDVNPGVGEEVRDGLIVDGSEGISQDAEIVDVDQARDLEASAAEMTLSETNTSPNSQEQDTRLDPVPVDLMTDQADVFAKGPYVADATVKVHLQLTSGVVTEISAPKTNEHVQEEGDTILEPVSIDSTFQLEEFVAEDPNCADGETELKDGSLMDNGGAMIREAEMHIETNVNDGEVPLGETSQNVQGEGDPMLDPVPVDSIANQEVGIANDSNLSDVLIVKEIQNLADSVVELLPHTEVVGTVKGDGSMIIDEKTAYSEATVLVDGTPSEAVQVGSGSSDDGRNQSAESNQVILEDKNTVLDSVCFGDTVAEIGDCAIGNNDFEAADIGMDESISELPVSENNVIEGVRNANEGNVIVDGSDDGEQKDKLKETTTEIAISEKDHFVRYYLPLDEPHFSISSLVWGKVKSHPWWPGQIFDPSDASKLATKYQKKDSFLIAYYGDKTFAWCDESQLKPFCSHFSQLEKQCSTDTFAKATRDILIELSRRIELGMACACLPEEYYINIRYQKVENAGIRGGTINSVVDKPMIANFLQPDKLLEYIQTLAQFPNGKVDRLEFGVAQSQLKAFYCSKGFPELPAFTACGGLMEIVPESSPISGKESIPASSDLVSIKGKEKIGETSLDKRDHEPKDVGLHLANGGKSKSAENLVLSSSSKKHKHIAVESDHVDSGKYKRRMLDPFGDMEAKEPSPTITSSFKIGEFICRAASQLAGTSSIVKCQSDAIQKKDDAMDFDALPGSPLENPTTKLIVSSEDFDSPIDEMLTQLCLTAQDPMAGYYFASSIVDFFTDFRNFCVSGSSEDNKHVEEYGGKRKRGRTKKVLSQSQQASSDLSSSEEDEKHILKHRKGMSKNVLATDISSSEEVKHVEKRKRGRPRKVDLQPASSGHSSSEEKQLIQKRKRGRPKKLTSQPTSPNYSYSENKKHVEQVEQVEHVEPVEKRKRGRPKKLNSQMVSSEIFPHDHRKDSYWSDVNNEKKRNERGHKESHKKRRKSSSSPIQQQIEQQMQLVTMNPNLKLTFAAERSIISVEEKIVDEAMPTALFLSFNNAKSLPSETDLIRIFGRYGPLKEAQTDVMRKTNCAKIVFKRRVDAERAFSSAGKYSIFGPGLLSYRLKYLPSTPNSTPQTTPQVIRDAASRAIPEDNHGPLSSENHDAVAISTSVENHDPVPISTTAERHDVATIGTLQINNDQSPSMTVTHDNHDPAVLTAAQEKISAGHAAESNSKLLGMLIQHCNDDYVAEEAEILVESDNLQPEEVAKEQFHENGHNPTTAGISRENLDGEPTGSLSDKYEEAPIEEHVETRTTSDAMQVDEKGGTLQISERAEAGMASDFVQVEAEGSDNIELGAEGVNTEASGSTQVEGEALKMEALEKNYFDAEGDNMVAADFIKVEAEYVNIEASNNVNVEAETVNIEVSDIMQVEVEGLKIEASENLQVETEGVHEDASDTMQVEAEGVHKDASGTMRVEAEGIGVEAPDNLQAEGSENVYVVTEVVNIEASDIMQVEAEGLNVAASDNLHVDAEGVAASDFIQIGDEGVQMEASDNLQVESGVNIEGLDTAQIEDGDVTMETSESVQVEAGFIIEGLDTAQSEAGDVTMETSKSIQVEAIGVNIETSDDIQAQEEGVKREASDSMQVESEGVNMVASDSVQVESVQVEAVGVNIETSNDIQAIGEGVKREASDSMQVASEGVNIEASDTVQVESVQVEAVGVNIETSDDIQVQGEGVKREASDTVQVAVQVEAVGVNIETSDDIQAQGEGVKREASDSMQVESEGVNIEASDTVQVESVQVEAVGVNIETSDDIQVQGKGVKREASDTVQVEAVQVEAVQVEAVGVNIETSDDIQVQGEGVKREASDSMPVKSEGVNIEASDTVQDESVQVEAVGVNIETSDDIQAQGVKREASDSM